MADEFDQQNDDDGTEEEEGTEDIEEKTPPSQDTKLTTISGVGPKTAEKLKAAGYDTIRKVAEAEPESLSQAVPGLSIAKAESIIEEAATLIEMTATQVERAAPTPSKIRKKKSEEAEPVRIEFPKAEEGGRTTQVTGLLSGVERENRERGVPIGPRWLTKFEKARIIGARALQISMGAPPLIPLESAPKELFALAEAELKAGVLPMTVRRTLPTGEYADIPLSTLLKYTRLD